MLCDNCGAELRKNWKFCPSCGSEIIHEDVFINIGNLLRSITREIESFEWVKKPMGYNTDMVEEQETFEMDNVYEEGYSKKRGSMQKSKLTVEPKTLAKNLGNRIIFHVKLPGADPEDVKLTELDESFEVRAHAEDKDYFKIITVPQGFSLADQYFENDKLVLEFSA